MKNAEEVTMKLDSVLTIDGIGALHEHCVAVLASAQKITIDASQVELLDGAILQLLIALVMEADTKNKQIIWHAPSEALVDGAQTLGLMTALGLDNRG